MTHLFSNSSPNMSDSAGLHEWAENFLPILPTSGQDSAVIKQTGHEHKLMLTPLNGDAGFRQYFRLNTKSPVMAVLAPPEHENTSAFVDISLCFQENGVHTPAIYAVNYEQGFLLLEDFGDQLLLPLLSFDSVDKFYGEAEKELVRIQQINHNSDIFPHYDSERLFDEMALFPQWFVEQLLGIELKPNDSRILDEAFSLLVENALEQQQVVVHRDYHARNLMLRSDNTIGVIDFQDAVVGPFSYDLVSLLRDCYIRWPADYVRQRVLNYYRHGITLDMFPHADDTKVMRWFDLMGLQRHIKVLGIFARLWLRDGKRGYLNDLPLVIRYTLEQLQPYPELQIFKDWFEHKILPELPQQNWYRPWQSAGEDQ